MRATREEVLDQDVVWTCDCSCWYWYISSINSDTGTTIDCVINKDKNDQAFTVDIGWIVDNRSIDGQMERFLKWYS